MIGSRIGVYEILARLGQGDIAHVYGLERLHSAQAQSLEETLALVMEITRRPMDGVSIQRVGQTGSLRAPLPRSAPRGLLETAYYPGFTSRGGNIRGYDVTADGQRFLMIKGSANPSESRSEMAIVLNWPPRP